MAPRRRSLKSKIWASVSEALLRWKIFRCRSPLVNCICGTLRNEQGTVQFGGQRLDGLQAHQRTHLGLARSFQLPRPFVSLTLADNIRIPLLYTVAARSGSYHAAHEIEERCGA